MFMGRLEKDITDLKKRGAENSNERYLSLVHVFVCFCCNETVT